MGKVEKIHEKLFKETLAKLESGEDLEKREYFVCEECGYPAMGEPPEKCLVCGASQESFYKVE